MQTVPVSYICLNIMLRHTAPAVSLLLLFLFHHESEAQVSGGLNFSNRRVLPPRILSSDNQRQQQQESQRQSQSISGSRQRQAFNPFAQNPSYYSSAYLTERIGRLEADMGQFSRALNAVPSSIRMTVSAYMAERINRVQEDIEDNSVRINDNQEKVDQVDQELKYIKNSNANMQKRMDRIEASQQEQGEAIADMKRILESLQQSRTSEDTTAGHVNSVFTTREIPDDNRLEDLGARIEDLNKRLNDTDVTLDGYDESIRSFASNILVLSDKTNQLESNSVSNLHWLSSIRTDVETLRNQVTALEDLKSTSTFVINDLQSSFLKLNSSLRSLSEIQQFQAFALNNLTSSVARSSQTSPETAHDEDAYEYGNSNSNSDMLFELATSLATIEESVKLIQENRATFNDEVDRKIRKISRDLTANEQNIHNLDGRMQSLEISLQNSYDDPSFVEEAIQNDSDYQSDSALLLTLRNQVASLNQTVNFHSETLNDLKPVLNQNRSSNGFLVENKVVSRPTMEDNVTNSVDDAYFISDDVLHDDVVFPNGIENYVTTSFLEKQLETFRKNLTALQATISSLAATNSDQPYAQEMSLESRKISTNSESVISDRINVLQTNVDVLNASVAVQGSMLQQAIRAMGDYDRRLRLAEENDNIKASELQQIRHLVVNATESFSSMSFTVAQNGLTIAHMADNARIGDDMLLDLSDQVFRHDVAIGSLNQTLKSMTRRNVDESSAFQSPSLANQDEAVQRITKQAGSDGALRSNYVTHSEFGGLADALTGIAERMDLIQGRQESVESALNSVKHNASLCYRLELDLVQVWTTLNSTNGLLDFLQNVIASVSASNVEIKQQVSSLGRSVLLLQNNSSGSAKSGLYGDEFIHLLDASVRDLRIEVNEQRTWLVNQRRRIRQLEDESVQTYAQISDVAILNDTVRRRLNSAESALRSLASDLLSRQATASFSDEDLTSSTLASNHTAVQQLKEDVAYLKQKINKQNRLNTANNTYNNRLILDEELRAVPLTLRIIEGQIQDFQGALQTLAALDAKVDTMRNIQSSVLKNSRDITTFHESVQNVEKELATLKRKLTVVEFSYQRLNSYQDDLRSRLNSTKHVLDQTNDETAIQGQKLRLLRRFLEGNTTELRGRIGESELRLDDQIERLSTSSRRINDLEQDVRQQEAADLLRHNDLDTRMLRDEKRIENLEDASIRNDDSLVTLTRSVSLETNSRRTAIEGIYSDLESLRQSAANLESEASDTKQIINQHNQRITEFRETQNRHSDEIQRLQNSHRSVSESVQTNNRLLQSREDNQRSLNDKINNNNADISALRNTITTQANSLLSIRQNIVVINDEINSLQESTQGNSAFSRRAEQAIEKLNSDIAFVLEHSSNQSVVIQRLKLRVSEKPETSINSTHELLSEVQLLEYNLRGTADELATLKRQVSVRENAALLLEDRITEVATKAVEFDDKTRSTADTIDRMRSDLRRYGDRVRILESNMQEHAVARNDLQQVVVSNRNELSIVNDMKSNLNQLKQEVTDSVSRQENRSFAFQRSLDEAKLTLNGMSSQIDDHDVLLRALRQERISAEASMDHILRASSSLEQLLRSTVTDLAQLKRDFDAGADGRNAVPRLQRIVSALESDFERTKLAVTSNENKLSRMQDLVDRSAASVTNLVTATQNRYSEEQSRDQSRTNDFRELRESFSRNAVLLRTIQNELRRHNERIQVLNQRVIEVDNRVANSISKISLESEDTNINADLKKESDISLETSGWIPLSTSEANLDFVKEQDASNSNNLNLNSSYHQLLQRIDDLSANVSVLIANFDLKFAFQQDHLYQGRNASYKSNMNNDTLLNSQMATLMKNLTQTVENRFQELILEKNEKSLSGSADEAASLSNLTVMFRDLQKQVGNITKEFRNTKYGKYVLSVAQHSISELVLKLANVLEDSIDSSNSLPSKESQTSETYPNVPTFEIGYEEEEQIYGSDSVSDSYQTSDDYSVPSDYTNTSQTVLHDFEERSSSANTVVKNITSILKEIAFVLVDTENKTENTSLEFSNSIITEMLNRLKIVEDTLSETRNNNKVQDSTSVFNKDSVSILTPSSGENGSYLTDDQFAQILMNDSMKRQEISAIRENQSLILKSVSEIFLSNENQLHRIRVLEDKSMLVASQNSNNNLSQRLMALEDQFLAREDERKIIPNDRLARLISIELEEWKDFKLVQENISLIFEALTQYQIASQQQQHQLLHLLFNQNTISEKLENVENATDKLELELDLLKVQLPQQQHLAEERLQARIDATKDRLINEQLLTVQQLFDVVQDVTALNTTVNRGNKLLLRLQTDLNRTLVDNLPQLMATSMENLAAIQEMQTKENNRKQKVDDLDLTLTIIFEQLESVENDINSINSNIELQRNATNQQINAERLKNMADKAEIEQKTDSLEQEMEEILSNITVLLRAQSNADLRLLHLNQSTFDGIADINDLRRETEILITAQDDLGLSLTRHSMELRGLSRTIRTFEELVGMLSDTVALQGRRISGLSGNVSQSAALDGRDVNFLSQILSNHSRQLESIQNQISILQTRVKTQSLVRIVVPPASGVNDNVELRRTTTEATSTRSPEITIPSPSSVSVTSLRFDQFIISWIPPSDPTISGYRVILENTQQPNDLLQIAAVAPPIKATGLSPSSRYMVSVHAVQDQQLSLPATVMATTDPRPTVSLTRVSTATTTTPPPILSTILTPDPNSIYSDELESSVPETVSDIEVFNCDFDDVGICGFTNDLNDEFDWTHGNGSTPSSDTGPSNDHTNDANSGFYMFIEASRPRQLGQVARLLSPVMQATEGQCLHFYYHMFGVGTGDLNVVLLSADGSSGKRVWGESGDRGNKWKKGKVTIAFHTSFRIAFEAVRGSDYHADTAIDDVTIQAGACPQPLLRCGFENSDICGFIQDYDDDFDWQRNNGATSSADTGPVNDHTLGTHAGYYLYLESSNPRVLNDKTRLSSPILRPTNGQCLQFYYHMHGSDIGSLNVYMRQQSNMRDLGNPIWSKSGPQGNDWFLGRATLVSSDSFQVVLEGVRGDDYHGDIAIDDVTVTDGKCDLPVCSSGLRFGGLCYEVKTDPRSYQGAADVCAANGGLLAAIKNKSIQDFIAQILLNNEASRWQMFWIGLDDRNVEGRFVFSDHSPLDDAESFWDAGEPIDSIGDEDCVNMEYASNGRRWNLAQCSTELGFICQYPIGT